MTSGDLEILNDCLYQCLVVGVIELCNLCEQIQSINTAVYTQCYNLRDSAVSDPELLICLNIFDLVFCCNEKVPYKEVLLTCGMCIHLA